MISTTPTDLYVYKVASVVCGALKIDRTEWLVIDVFLCQKFGCPDWDVYAVHSVYALQETKAWVIRPDL